MKKTKFTEQQIAFALKQAEMGTRMDEVCRKMCIRKPHFIHWRKSGLDTSFWPLTAIAQWAESPIRIR